VSDFCRGLLRIGARAAAGEVSRAEVLDLGGREHFCSLLLQVPPGQALVEGRSTCRRGIARSHRGKELGAVHDFWLGESCAGDKAWSEKGYVLILSRDCRFATESRGGV
jgi:hypothetical protein